MDYLLKNKDELVAYLEVSQGLADTQLEERFERTVNIKVHDVSKDNGKFIKDVTAGAQKIHEDNQQSKRNRDA